MEHKAPPRRSTKKPANPSVAGEEDPGAALDGGDEALPGTPGTARRCATAVAAVAGSTTHRAPPAAAPARWCKASVAG